MAAQESGGAVARGFAWVLLARMADRLLGLASIAIMARCLSPSDFGIFQMAFSVVMLFEIFSMHGFEWSLVLAYPFSIYFRTPELAWVIAVMAFTPLGRGLENLAIVHLRREGRFNADFVRMTVPRMLGVLAGITLALAWPSHWALVGGYATYKLFNAAICYVLHSYRPRLTLVRWRELMSYSVWMLLSNIVESLRSRVLDLIIGRVLGSHSLALFNMSHDLANLPLVEFVGSLNTAVFPSYARMQEDKGLLRSAYVDVVALTLLAGMPIALGLAMVAPSAVRLLLGQAWSEAVPIVQLVAFGALATAVCSNTSYVLWIVGRPRIHTALSVLFLAVLVVVLPIQIWRLGLTGAAVAYTAVSLLMLPVHAILLNRIIGVGIVEVLQRMWRGVLALACMWAALRLVAPVGIPASALEAFVSLAKCVATGASAYVGVVLALWAICGRPAGIERTMLAIVQGFIAHLAGRGRAGTRDPV